MDDSFQESGDNCITNPKNCEFGLSVSVFYNAELDVDPGDLGTNLHQYTDKRETLLSTGGDYGYPGIQIYREGPSTAIAQLSDFRIIFKVLCLEGLSALGMRPGR